MKKLIFLVLLLAVGFGVAVWKWGFNPIPARKVAGRVALWQQTVDRDIPPGTGQREIIEWGLKNDVTLHLLQKRDLYGLIETMEPEGINFPCSRWNIILEITMNPAKESVRQKVRASDGCK